MPTASERLAALAFERVPERVREAAHLHLVDTVAAWVAGSAPLSRGLRAIDAGLSLSGGAMAHCFEVDDIHQGTTICPGCAVVPAALEAADLNTEVSGDALLAAIAVGYEAAIRTGMGAATASQLAHGWWPTALAGPVGAAVAAGRLLGIDQVRLAHAIGIAGLHAGGLITGGVEGPSGRHLAAGSPAARGLLAARAAAAGWTGPLRLFEDPRGYSGVPHDPARWADAFGADPQMPETAIKPYACARQLHAAVAALLNVMAEAGTKADDLEEVTCYLPSPCYRITNRPEPPANATAASGSGRYVLAVAALRGELLVAEYEPDVMNDARVLSLMTRIKLAPAEDLDALYPRLWPARVEVTLKGGRRRAVQLESAPGGADAPIGPELFRAKFDRLVGPVLGNAGAKRLWDVLHQLDRPGAVEALVKQLRSL